MRWLALFCLSCIGKDLRTPGESLGFYNVVGTLEANTCGEAPSPWTFRVELRREATRLYWAQGDMPIGAPLAGDGSAKFRAESRMSVSAPTKKSAGCTVVRQDTVDMQLKSTATADDSFVGTLVYEFAPEQGTECPNPNPAGVEVVPCTVRYALAGQAQVEGGK
jgi:hypothetical protein